MICHFLNWLSKMNVFVNNNFILMKMKYILSLVLGLCLSLGARCQSLSQSNTKQTTASPDNKVNFRLFQTNNRWTFLKLDTRNGEIMQVQYDMGDNAMQYPLNLKPLAYGDDAKPGRFFLYPTENTFNFLLLDQVDGRVWQVQWNFEANKRGIWKIDW